MNPSLLPSIFAGFLLALTAPVVSSAQLVFADDFNRADDTSLGSDWAEFNNGGEASISSNELLLSVPATDTESRAVVQVNISDFSADILAGGAFQVSFNLDPGVDYNGTGPSGAYGLRVYLGPKAIVENGNVGFGNDNNGLRYQITGNGGALMRDENGTVFVPASAPNGVVDIPGWTNETPTTFNLVVNTDTFGTSGGTNSATLTIGGQTVFDDVSFGQWTEANDLYLGIEAYSGSQATGSSTIDNLEVSAIPEPNAAGLLAGAASLGLLLAQRRRNAESL